MQQVSGAGHARRQADIRLRGRRIPAGMVVQEHQIHRSVTQRLQKKLPGRSQRGVDRAHGKHHLVQQAVPRIEHGDTHLLLGEIAHVLHKIGGDGRRVPQGNGRALAAPYDPAAELGNRQQFHGFYRADPVDRLKFSAGKRHQAAQSGPASEFLQKRAGDFDRRLLRGPGPQDHGQQLRVGKHAGSVFPAFLVRQFGRRKGPHHFVLFQITPFVFPGPPKERL